MNSPIRRREPDPLSAWPSVPTPVAHHQRVLVIEDNVDAAQTLAMLLDLLGYEVRISYTGPDGVRDALGWTPDAILCDIGLPGLDGYGVARQLRSRPPTRDTLLIALTAHGSDEDKQRASDAGFNHHVTKPADPNALIRLLCPVVNA